MTGPRHAPRQPERDRVTDPDGEQREKGDSFPIIPSPKKRSLMVRPRPGRPPKRGWRDRFLWVLRKTGSKVQAARRAHVARSTVIAWEAADPAFRQAVAQAKQEATGERLAARYNADPSLPNLIALLAVLRPEKYAGLVRQRSRPTPRARAAPAEAASAYLREMLRSQEPGV
jgi:hypothetical protein